MGPDVLADVHETIQQLWDVGAVGRLTDAQLLRHVLAGPEARSEAAFTVLVERHGPAVRRVCVDLLRNPHDAEDAAQAVFLVLARKARSIRKPEALASWLHGVAVRLARKIRAEAARRRTVEQRGAWIMAARVLSKAPADLDPYVELHQEIDRLPEKYRSPIVLCDLEGQTQEQAAQRLGWPLGTVQSRLHRGRERLRARLVRRGVGLLLLTATGFSLPTRATTCAALPTGWARATASAALRFAAGQSTAGLVAPAVVHLAQGLLARKVGKWFAVMVLAVGLAAGGGVMLSAQPAPGVRKPQLKAAAPVAVAAERQAERKPLPALPPRGPELDAVIAAGVRYLKSAQQADGSWKEIDNEAATGMTSLVTLALAAADEPADSHSIRRASEYLRRFTPDQLHSVYAVSLQTRVYAALGLEQDRPRIAQNVEWLERAQIEDGDRVHWPGSWTYSQHKNRHGDNSNTHFALLGLDAAAAVGIPVKPIVWANALMYWDQAQHQDGGWAYTPDANAGTTASMTGAGISSLIVCRSRLAESERLPEGGDERRCGKGAERAHVRRGLDWLNTRYLLGQNFGNNQQWKFYWLEVLERVGALTGERLIKGHDWFREEAEELVRAQDLLDGSWKGVIVEGERLVATSFALLFLCQGRAPVLIQKARHGPGNDWMNDPDDVRHLVDAVARGAKQRMSWQVVDLDTADVDDLLRVPILFLNGHEAPVLNDRAKTALRAYVKRGGFLFAEACCGNVGFDRGFRALMNELFPGPDAVPLHPIAHDRPVWTARHRLEPDHHSLWGLEIGDKTAVMYSQNDLSCHWSLWGSGGPKDPATIDAIQLGENVVVYARTRDVPARP